MYKNTYTSPLIMDIGMSAVIFIIALLTMVGMILRVIASCINSMARIVYLISDGGTRVYSNALAWHRPKAVKYTTD